jgi:hypothetical protein
MFDWLFEGRIGVIVALAAVALVLFVAWWRVRRRGLLVAAGVAAALLGVYVLLDQLVETDREAGRKQIPARLGEMAAAASKGDADGVLKYVSDKFRVGGTDKEALGAKVRQNAGYVPKDIAFDQFDFGDGPRPSDGTATVRFRVKTQQYGNYRCEAVFDYDAQHGWRLKTFKLFGPLPEEKTEVRLPL